MDGAQADDARSLCALRITRETAEQALNALYAMQSTIQASCSGKTRRFRFKLELENATDSLEQYYQKITQVQAQMFADNQTAIKYAFHWTLLKSRELVPVDDVDDFSSLAAHHQFRIDPKPAPNFDAVGYLLPHINQGFAAIQSILSTGGARGKIWTTKQSKQLIVECSKLKVLVSLIPAALAIPASSVVSPTKLMIDAVAIPSDPESLSQNLATFASRLEKVKCMVYDAIRHSNCFMQHIKLAASGIYYSANPERARHESNVVGVDPDIRLIKFMWNLTEHAAGRAVYKVTFPPIAQHETFYISPSDLTDDPDLDQPPVKVRYLSARRSSQVSMNIESIRNRKNPAQCQENVFLNPLDALILHFHGGGFVAQSSYSHQSYSRQWANGANVAILSVDYRLAPEAQYPAPVNDAWLVYLWCLHNGQRILGIDPTRIVLAGDSAGGNIAAALVNRSLTKNVQLPAGLFMAYPCLCLSADVFYPSSLSCLDEVMIPYGFLLACIKAYVPNHADPLHDPELSPAVTPDEILRRYPPVKIMMGSRDPLLDQSLEFAQRLHNLKCKVQLAVYSEFGHGFLSFDNPVVGVPESHACVLKSIEWLRELTKPSSLLETASHHN